MAVLFCVCLITSNLFEARLWQVWGLPMQLTGGLWIFPVSYIINDCLTEVWGYRKARLVIWMAFSLSAFVAVSGHLVSLLPAPFYEDGYEAANSFNVLFGIVPRTTFASLLAFFVGSSINAYVMSKMKVSSKGKRFGVRAIMSSIFGEIADSLIFFPIAMYGLMPFEGMVSIMLAQVVLKTMYEVLVLPVTAMVVKKVKQIEHEDTFDENISYNPFRISDI